MTHIKERPYLRCRERDVLVVNHNLQLLAALRVGLGPIAVVTGEDPANLDDAPQLVDDGGGHVRHFPDDALWFVAGVVEVPQLAVLFDFVLDEFVSKLSFMPNTIKNKKLIS